MKIEWSMLARADRASIFDYIEADSPRAAITVDERIELQIAGLRRFPRKGRPGRLDGTRELVIDRTPYIAAYCVVGNTVKILRILHGARQWPDRLIEGSK